MKLSITVTDQRHNPARANQFGPPFEYEDYERVDIEGADATPAVLAGILRSIADDIDPRRGDA